MIDGENINLYTRSRGLYSTWSLIFESTSEANVNCGTTFLLRIYLYIIVFFLFFFFLQKIKINDSSRSVFFYFFNLKILILVPRPFFFFCKKDESNAVKFPPLFFPLKSSLHLLNEFNLPPWIYFYFYLLFFYSFDFFFFCIITVAVKTSGLMRKFRYVGKRNFFFCWSGRVFH